jgi:hypothetical protein
MFKLNVIYLFQAIWGLNNLDFRGYNKLYSDFTYFEAFQNRRNCPISDPSKNDVVLSGTSKFKNLFCWLSKLSLFLIIWAGIMHDSAQELNPIKSITIRQ